MKIRKYIQFTTPEVYGQLTRWRSTNHIMDEIINDVRDFKIGEIQFDDDTLTVNRKNLMDFLTLEVT